MLAIYSRLARVSGGQPPATTGATGDPRREASRLVRPGHEIHRHRAKTVRLCQSMDQDPVTLFYLGHELYTFYKDHAWAAGFGSRFPLRRRGLIRPISEQQRLTSKRRPTMSASSMDTLPASAARGCRKCAEPGVQGHAISADMPD